MNLSPQQIETAYTDALTRWLKAQKEYPGLYFGPEPLPSEYWQGPMTTLEIWHAEQVRNRVKREMERTA